MTNALKKELAGLSAFGALFAFRRGKSRLTTTLALGAAGLFLSAIYQRYSLRNKCVLVTGGSRGLGLSLAWNLVRQGAKVTLMARDNDELERARAILLADFPTAQICTLACDVTETEQLKNCIDSAIETMGDLDVVIHDAGAMLVGPFEATEASDFEAQMKLHVYAVIESTRHLLPHFKARGEGRIVNICSLGGKVAVPHMIPYDTSKFALAGFSQGITSELAPFGVNVTTVYPTVMRTGSPIQAVFKGDHEKEYEWFASLDNLRGLSMSPHAAAVKILNALKDGKTELVLSIPAKLRLFMGVLLPETMNAVMGVAARLLPTGTSRTRLTGADSEARFQANPVFKSLTRTATKAEVMYNQSPHHDAERAMGIDPSKMH